MKKLYGIIWETPEAQNSYTIKFRKFFSERIMLEIIYWCFIILVFFRYFGPIIVTFKLHSSNAQKPTQAYDRAACWDVYASEDVLAIPENQWREIPLDISFAPWPHIYIKFLNLTITPFGNVAYEIHSRSGMALKKGARNHLGIIDNDYREALSAIMYNHGSYPIRIKKGMKVAQIKFYRVPSVWMWRRNKLSKSERGTDGLGSTGN